ncbi:hypothetical protein [Sporomusa sp. KB1]|uniref:hypothetical protein n=1 Tax=Sporomusa sp. KB1 TaxID=943346 RepID=UPI0011A0CF93|nr:hypothetical protein [Sporomusa sp. KB1]TWH46761.1 hypothetical protein Salpa_2772 [Sporomusa sp. KB1]
MNSLDNYIIEHLIPRLNSYSLNKKIVSIVAEDINNRLQAIINRWNDPYFRRTVLFTGVEEANFYSPQAKLDIKSIVVLGVRNSLLEDIASTNQEAKKFALEKPVIQDEHIIHFTGDAIRCFKDVNFEKLAQNIQPGDSNPYEHLKDHYPFAWAALWALTKTIGNESRFPPVRESNTIDYIPTIIRPLADQNTNKVEATIMSGMDPTIDNNLLRNLQAIANKHVNIFFVDSFKMLSRNPDKLFKVIDFVLRHGSSFVSFNYFINNGYVSRRRSLLKPAHLTKEIRYKLHKSDGLTKNHRDALNNVKSSLWRCYL